LGTNQNILQAQKVVIAGDLEMNFDLR